MTRLTASHEAKAEFLATLANPQRLKVLETLGHREMSVGSLVRIIGMSQSALSQHLAKLRAGGLVRTRRDAQTIYCSVSSPNVQRVLAMLEDVSFEQQQRLAG